MNKPVAWMFRGYLYEENPSSWTAHEHPNVPVIPLYTHPIKEQEPDLYSEDGFPLWTSPQFKELTDEEIDEISKEVWERPWLEVHRKFARAILRKAQEK